MRRARAPRRLISASQARCPPADTSTQACNGMESSYVLAGWLPEARPLGAATRGCRTSVRMQGVHAFYETVRGRAVVRTPLRKQPYGDWEFEVRDPNGYILVFSELTD